MRAIKSLAIYVFSLFFLLNCGILIKGALLQASSRPLPTVLAEHTTEISLSIGFFQRYSLFGYTSSRSTVKLEGIGLSQETNADAKGYFEFNDFLASTKSKEFCLTTIDTEKLIAPPLCFAAPQNVKGKKFGPFLLPPTITVNNSGKTQGVVSGKTIPGTEVQINLFTDKKNVLSRISLIAPVYAQTQKKHTTTSQSDGTFTTRIKTINEGKVRLFAQSLYNTQKTPKSFTLTLSILSGWYVWILEILAILKPLFSPSTLIVLQVGIITFLAYKKYKKVIPFIFKKDKRHFELMIVEHKALLIQKQKEIVEFKKQLPKTN